MTKLIVQIPCYNEEHTLPITVADIPREIDGVDVVEILIIDDGSTDKTVEVARSIGVDRIVQHPANRGLAITFQTGLNACLKYGADIIVNTDGDNQYPGAMIPELIRPILENRADLVIGDRQTDTIAHFSPVKRLLQRVGSAVTSAIANTKVNDAPSGFRAYSRETALKLSIFTSYTYTIETILQAAYKQLRVVFIPITTNAKTRESRLVKSIPLYIWRTGKSMLHLFLIYNTLCTFLILSVPFFIVGTIAWGRFFILWVSGLTERASNIQSILFGTLAYIIAGFLVATGLLGHLIAINRQIQEEIVYRIRKQQYDPDAFRATGTHPVIPRHD